MALDFARIRQKLIPWAMKGGLAILDQGVFSGSNFIISILLARWMSAEEYGTYAVAFAVFLFLLNFHQALLLEPMLVFGSSVYRDCLRGYMKALLVLHLGISLIMVVGLTVSALVAFRSPHADGLPIALIGIAIAAPCILLFWLTKRTFYLKLAPAPSVAGALLYCALTIGGLAVIYRHGLLSTFTALVLMGFGGLGASIVLLAYLSLRLPKQQTSPTIRDTWTRHWRYGRWALGANAMMWIPINAFYPLVSKFAGLAQAGELKALMNFASPMLQTCAALSSLMLPYAARVMSQRACDGVNVILRRMTLLCVACAIPYWVVLVVFQKPAFRLLYSGRYTEVAYLMPVVALASIAGSAFFGPSIVLRSLEAPKLVFAAVSVSSCISAAAGIPLTHAFGVSGAVWSIVLSETLAFVAAIVLLRRKADTASRQAPALVTHRRAIKTTVVGRNDREKKTAIISKGKDINRMRTYRLLHAKVARSKIRVPLVWSWHVGLKPQDVFQASYPRSGSTWLRFMLFEILCGEEPGFRKIEERLPEIQWQRGKAGILANGGRFVKTHEQYRNEYKRAVFLVRDMRDVLLSCYARGLQDGIVELVSKGDFDSYLMSFLQGSALQMGSWHEHTHTWLESPIAKNGDMLLVKYEDLRKNPEPMLAQILDFVGVKPNLQVIRKAVEGNSLQQMRAKEDRAKKEGEFSILLGPHKSTGEDGRFVRKGSVGGWRNKLTDAQLQLIDEYAGDMLTRLGYDLGANIERQAQPEMPAFTV